MGRKAREGLYVYFTFFTSKVRERKGKGEDWGKKGKVKRGKGKGKEREKEGRRAPSIEISGYATNARYERSVF